MHIVEIERAKLGCICVRVGYERTVHLQFARATSAFLDRENPRSGKHAAHGDVLEPADLSREARKVSDNGTLPSTNNRIFA